MEFEETEKSAEKEKKQYHQPEIVEKNKLTTELLSTDLPAEPPPP